MSAQSLSSSALVCRASEYRDNDYILTMVAPEFGRISAIARGAKKQGSRLFADVQPFCYGDYMFQRRGERLSVVSSDVKERFYPITQQYERFAAGQAVLQILADLAQPGEDCSSLFALSYYVLSHLSYGAGNTGDIILYYLLQVLQEQGVKPSSVRCALCGGSTYERAAFHKRFGALCGDCAQKHGGRAISALSLEAVFRMLRLPKESLDKLSLPENVRAELEAVLPGYFEGQMDQKYSSLQLLYEKI